MKKFLLAPIIAVALALSASPAFPQEREKPDAMEGHGMMGDGMNQGSMMCPMMGGAGMMSMGGIGMMDGRPGRWRPGDDGADDADAG